MWGAAHGNTDIVIALAKAKANINAKNEVCVGLSGWMVVCAEVEHPLGLGALEPFSCRANRVDTITPITTIQRGWDAMRVAEHAKHDDIVTLLEQVVGGCDGVYMCDCMCVGE